LRLIVVMLKVEMLSPLRKVKIDIINYKSDI
jgi:hypothetical protein